MKKKSVIDLLLIWQENKKLLLTMKLMTLIMTLTFFQAAGSLYSQNTTFNFHLKNVPVKSVLQKIENSSDFKFLYRTEFLDVNRKVDVTADNDRVETILENIFNSFDITYRVFEDNLIVITNNRMMQQQQRVVSGTVTDTKGALLPGVSISVKGTTFGTITDIQGNYELSLPADAQVLVFSYVGMKTQEITIGDVTVFNITMEEEAIGLEEVIAVGYGTMNKSDLTGASIRADIEAFSEAPNVNIMQSLHGSVPGIQIGQVNHAGEEPSISIRGQTTLSGNYNPLIVVDGIIYRGSIGNINPDDIQSIDILKDASSKAVYGAQASNGVILLTTKSGKKGVKPTIRYTSSISSQTPTVKSELQGREDWLQKVKDVQFDEAYLSPEYTEPNPDWNFNLSGLTPEQRDGIENGTDYDWWDALTSPGFIINHFLSTAGGAEKITYHISGGYTEQEGFIINDDYRRITYRINIENDITNWLTIGANTFGSFNDFSGTYPTMSYVTGGSPVVKPKDENGEWIINPYGTSAVNILLNAEADDRELRNEISGIFYGVIKIPKINGLTYRVNFSNNLNWRSHSMSDKYAVGITGAVSKINNSQKYIIFDNILTYDKNFNENRLKITVVSGYDKVEYDMTSASGENIPNLALSYNDLGQAIIQVISSDAWEEKSIYQMGRMHYSFKNRYLATATLRRDGFSGFAKNNKFAFFPSAGLGWVLSDESFFTIPKIDYLKLRVSYGQNGNKTARYSSLAKISKGDDSKYVFGDGAKY